MLLSDAVGAVRAVESCCAAAVRRWAVAVRCCQVVLSGCGQALTHTSHTYDTIKRALTIKGALTPMTPAATQLPYGVITPAAAAGTATG